MNWTKDIFWNTLEGRVRNRVDTFLYTEIAQRSQEDLMLYMQIRDHLPPLSNMLTKRNPMLMKSICEQIRRRVVVLSSTYPQAEYLYDKYGQLLRDALVKNLQDYKTELHEKQQQAALLQFAKHIAKHHGGVFTPALLREFVVRWQPVGKKLYNLYQYKYGSQRISVVEDELSHITPHAPVRAPEKFPSLTIEQINAWLRDFLKWLPTGTRRTGGTLAGYEQKEWDTIWSRIKNWLRARYGTERHEYLYMHVPPKLLAKHTFVRRINREDDQVREEILTFLRTLPKGKERTKGELSKLSLQPGDNWGVNLAETLWRRFGHDRYTQLAARLPSKYLKRNPFSTKGLQMSPEMVAEYFLLFLESLAPGEQRYMKRLYDFEHKPWDHMWKNLYTHLRKTYGKKRVQALQDIVWPDYDVVDRYIKKSEKLSDAEISEKLHMFFASLPQNGWRSPVVFRTFEVVPGDNFWKNLERVLYTKYGKSLYTKLATYVPQGLLDQHAFTQRHKHTNESITRITEEVIAFVREHHLSSRGPRLIQKYFSNLHHRIIRNYKTEQGIDRLGFIVSYVSLEDLTNYSFRYWGRDILLDDVVPIKRSKTPADMNLWRGVEDVTVNIEEEYLIREEHEILERVLKSLANNDRALVHDFMEGTLSSSDPRMQRVLGILKGEMMRYYEI